MEDTAKRREDIMRKVAALLAKAESTGFSEERDALIAKADQLMMAYQIEAFELEFRKSKSERRTPEVRVFEYGTTGNREADQEMVQVFHDLARMVGVHLGFWGWQTSKAVGYAEDLEYLQMLFMNIRLHLALQLEPKPDPKLPLEDNVAMLKEAGLKWVRIHELLKTAGIMENIPWERRIGVRFTKIYTDFCKENNRERVYTNPDVWKRNFIQGYCSEIRQRIREMTSARHQAAQGHELVLASMKDELLEFLYQNFPHLRPHPPTCDCDMCHRCTNPKCNRPNCVARRTPVKYNDRPRTVRELKYDASAANRGRQVARTADLGSARGAPAPKAKEIN